jgi:hypothetical protein
MLPVDKVKIDPVTVNNIGLGKSIYTKKQLEEFAAIQDSQGTCKAYLAETSDLAYMGRNEKGEWDLALGDQVQLSLVNLVGMSFFPLYSVVGPLIFFLSLLLMVWGGLPADSDNLPQSGNNHEIQGMWSVGVDSLLGHIIPAGCLPIQLD